MDPRKFLELAQLLASGNAQAERLRTATSRSYYAAYNMSSQILKDMGFRVTHGPGGHGEVRNKLGNSKDPDLEAVSSQLGSLHHNRITADYKLEDQMAEKQKNVQAHVEQAKRMIKILETRCSGSGRESIISAIQEWERLTNQRTSSS